MGSLGTALTVGLALVAIAIPSYGAMLLGGPMLGVVVGIFLALGIVGGRWLAVRMGGGGQQPSANRGRTRQSKGASSRDR